MEWTKEIDYTKHLTGDQRDIAELIGIQNLLKLIDRFNKTPVYFSDKCLLSMKREYILENVGGASPKQLARMLDLSERYVYEIINERHLGDSQLELQL